MTWVAIGFGIAGAAVSVVGQQKGAKNAKRLGESNALISEAQAQDSLLRGAIDESMYRRQIAQIIGAQKASFGARNVAVSGTALDILGDTAQVGEEDAQTIRANAAREAWGYRNQADDSRRFGKNAQTQANWTSASTLLTSGAQAYGQFPRG